MHRQIISALTALALFLSNAEATSLVNVQGSVTASMGHGFIPVSDGAVLAPGAIVRTSDTAAASIVYDNGCVVPLGPRQQVAVLDSPPCQSNPFEFSDVFGNLSAGEILTGLAVVLGLVAIIVASTAKTKSANGSL